MFTHATFTTYIFPTAHKFCASALLAFLVPKSRTVRPPLSGHVGTGTYPDKRFVRIWELCLNTIKYKVYTLYYSLLLNLKQSIVAKYKMDEMNEIKQEFIHFILFWARFYVKISIKQKLDRIILQDRGRITGGRITEVQSSSFRNSIHMTSLSRALGWEIWKTTFITEISVCVQWELFYDFFF